MVTVWAESNLLTNIDVTNATSLVELDIRSNNLTQLDLATNTQLKTLICQENQLIQLDVTSNALLENLYCRSNPLPELDVSQNYLLKNLGFGGDVISSINLTNNPNLEYLYLSESVNLTTLDLSGNPVLNYISLPHSHFTTLDVSNNPLLAYFGSYAGMFQSLDFSNNPMLTTLGLYYNQLQSLNLKNGNNAMLEGVNIEENENLFCVEVDDPVAANNGEGVYGSWTTDLGLVYSDECVLGVALPQPVFVRLYPNPVTKMLYLNSGEIPITSVVVYNIQGIAVASATHTKKIDLSKLSTGVYFATITTPQGKLIKKVVKR